jgi:endonuclease YncB( thermonuclease family)
LAGVLLATMGASVSPLRADDIIGRAKDVDGDTIEIGKTRIRLFGIDAPEGGQTCARDNSEVYDCAAEASRALAALVARGRTVCDPKDIDRFKRPVAVCYTRGLDLGAELVFQGWAVAFRRYSDMYVALEDWARQARYGMWAGTFQKPWDWRAEQRRPVR